MQILNSKILKLSPWMIMVAVFLMYPSSAQAFYGMVIDHKVSIHWDGVIYAMIGQTILFFSMAYLLGVGVIRKGWDVNYTRKVLQIGIFLIPFILMMPNILSVDVEELRQKGIRIELLYNRAFPVYVLTGVVVMGWMYLFSGWLRQKYKFLAVAFSAIDRPEDSGMTLYWLRTEIAAVYGILALYNLFYIAHLYIVFSAILTLAMIVSSIGDGLAGIVGRKYGKHPYAVKALFIDRVYTRTWEGSFCIYVVTFIAILIAWMFTKDLSYVFLPMLLVVPVAATYAEIKSPHSWDNPFIIGAIIISSWVSIVTFLFLKSLLFHL